MDKMFLDTIINMELRDFFLQLSTMIKSGLTIGQALHIMGPQFAASGSLGNKVREMGQMVELGNKLSDAMMKTGEPFSQLHISFIRFAEESGSMDRILPILASHAEKEVSISWKVVQAFIYPGFVLFVALMMHPIFLFFTQGTGLIQAIVSLVFFAGLILGGQYGFKAFGKGRLDGVLIRLPYFGKLIRTMAWARFSRTLSMSQHAGISLVQGINTSIEVGNSPWLREQLKHLPEFIENGKSLSDGLAIVPNLPPSMRETIMVGEQTGTLAEMLGKVAEYFEEDVSNNVDAILKILPVVVFLMVAVVAAFSIVSMWTQAFGQRFR